MVVEVTDSVPDPAAMEAPADRESAERALPTWTSSRVPR